MTILDELITAAGLDDLSPERRAATRCVLIVHRAMQGRTASVWDDLERRLVIARRGAVDNAALLGQYLHRMGRLGPIAITNALLDDVNAFRSGPSVVDLLRNRGEINLAVTTARLCIHEDKERRAADKAKEATPEMEAMLEPRDPRGEVPRAWLGLGARPRSPTSASVR